MVSSSHSQNKPPFAISWVISLGLHAVVLWSFIQSDASPIRAQPPLQVTIASAMPVAKTTLSTADDDAPAVNAQPSAQAGSSTTDNTGSSGALVNEAVVVQADSVIVGARPRGWGGREYITVEQRGERTLIEVMPLLQSAILQLPSVDCEFQISANSYVAHLRCDNPLDQQRLLSLLSGRFSFQEQPYQTYACIRLKDANVSVEKKMHITLSDVHLPLCELLFDHFAVAHSDVILERVQG